MPRPKREKNHHKCVQQNCVVADQNPATEQRPATSTADDQPAPYLVKVRLWFSVAVISAVLAYGMYVGNDKLTWTVLLFASKSLWSAGKAFSAEVLDKLAELKRKGPLL